MAAPEFVSAPTIRRYALHGEIGSDAVASLHVGRQLGPDGFARTVAIKRLRPHYALDPELVTMLVDGARLAGRIRHAHVLPVLDVVTGGELLVVMEYVHGESLATLLRTLRGRDAPAPLAIVSGVLTGLLRGLHAVHGAREERVDTSRHRPREAGSLAVVVGTDGVARSMDLDARGSRAHDLAAASTVLWEALAGRQLLPRICPEGYEPPSRYRAELTPEIDAVALKGLAQGFLTAQDMAVALEAAIPPATLSTIGTWVESLARPALEERASLVATVEELETHGDAAPAAKKADAAASVHPAAFVTKRERASVPPTSGTMRDLGRTDEAAPAETPATDRAAATESDASAPNLGETVAPHTPKGERSATGSLALVTSTTEPTARRSIRYGLPRHGRAAVLAVVAAASVTLIAGVRYAVSVSGSFSPIGATPATSPPPAAVGDLPQPTAEAVPTRPEPAPSLPSPSPDALPVDAPKAEAPRPMSSKTSAPRVAPFPTSSSRPVKPRRAESKRDDVL